MSCNSKECDATKGCEDETLHRDVKAYYGKVLKTQEDLKVPACLAPSRTVPRHIKEAINSVHEEVTKRYYGCGMVIPQVLEGASILDLGSGTGRDCFAISKLVGENGHVTGIDMTEEQIAIANSYIKYHTEKFGYQEPNTNFVQGYIEKLGEAGLQDQTFDIIISNCVINLSPDKRSTFMEAYKVLKPGGEMYFSDIYADRDLPENVRKHKVLWGECISGALWWKQLYHVAKGLGFATPRLVSARRIPIERSDFKQVLGDARFFSATYRLFKLPKDAVKCQSVATYKGGIIGAEGNLSFDHEYTFEEGKPLLVDGELAAILKYSRFKKYFSLEDDIKEKVKQVPVLNLADVTSSTDTADCCKGSSCCTGSSARS